MIVSVRLSPGRSIAVDEFVDLTAVPVSDLSFVAGGKLEVSFDGDLDEATVRAVRRRMMAADDAAEELLTDIAERATAIAGWPVPEVPTLEDIAALGAVLVTQVSALTRYIQRED